MTAALIFGIAAFALCWCVQPALPLANLHPDDDEALQDAGVGFSIHTEAFDAAQQ